jgi:hypothetical protein
MKQEIVEKALHTVDMIYISKLMDSPYQLEIGRILARAHDVLGGKSWVLAGLEAITTGHPELAASFAIADFFSTLEALEQPAEEPRMPPLPSMRWVSNWLSKRIYSITPLVTYRMHDREAQNERNRFGFEGSRSHAGR